MTARAPGSSPLTRGKLASATDKVAKRGLTPAHAGKTTRNQYRGYHTRAHPRSRGENQLRYGHHGWHGGSSPLTRGKPAEMLRLSPAAGLIPAHAGKTRAAPRRGRAIGAHPRSRGENSRAASSPTTFPGSSPLTRGKRASRGRERQGVRLIPAHAGKTSTRASPPTTSRAHPRSRGENPGTYAAVGAVAGSSPLTRGKRCPVGGRAHGRGLIPAHAGKTARERR